MDELRKAFDKWRYDNQLLDDEARLKFYTFSDGFEAGSNTHEAEIEKLKQDCKNLIEINNNQSKIVDELTTEKKKLREALEGCYMEVKNATSLRCECVKSIVKQALKGE